MSCARRIVFILAIASMPFAFTACSVYVKEGQRHGEVTLSIGHSPSERGAQLAIKRCAQGAVEYAAREGAVLYVARVGDAADTQWTRVDFHLHGASQETNRTAARKADELHSVEARRAIDGILASPIEPASSDQINSLALAGRILAHASGPRLAVICADGHTVSPELNIYQRPLDPDDARIALAAVRRELTSMRGVRVYWGDAGGDGAHLPGTREAEIARFWTVTWAQAVHARSVSYQQVLELPEVG
jgi:hypothetical protein